MKQDMILILDLGSEENPCRAREIRALGVYSEIHPHDITLEEVKALPNVKGIILNGGPNRVVDGVEIDAAKEIYNHDVPVLLADHKGDQPWPSDEEERKQALSNFVFGVRRPAQLEYGELHCRPGGADPAAGRRPEGPAGPLRRCGLLRSGCPLIRAIGKQLTCVHVNHGLLRKGEPEQVVEVFRHQMDANLIYVDAVDRFLDKLAGAADPEQKRKIIGTEFIRVFEEEARKLEGIEFLAQGTIYPDIIESGTKTVKAVKSHHNVGGLPEDLKFELVEPLKMLFKDEVRACGKALGLPDSMVYRQPFPGPGLGVRCLGAITRDRLEAVRGIRRHPTGGVCCRRTPGKGLAVLSQWCPISSLGGRGGGGPFSGRGTLLAVSTAAPAPPPQGGGAPPPPHNTHHLPQTPGGRTAPCALAPETPRND